MENLHPEFKRIMTNSFIGAKSFGYREVLPEHILLAIVAEEDNLGIRLFTELGLDLDTIATYFHNLCSINKPYTLTEVEVSPSEEIKGIVRHMHELREAYGFKEATLVHLFASILQNKNEVTKYFNSLNVNYNSMMEKLNNDTIKSSLGDFSDDKGGDASDNPKHDRKERRGKNKTAVLDNFCRNISKMADDNELDPVIGRDPEVEDICRILARRKKNNPIILGEPGTGKSAIAEGLAIKIREGKVPNILSGKKIYSLDLSSVVAGTKYRGQFEERMQALIKELTENKDIILFIDEIHTIVGAGNTNGSLDAANIFKPALANGELQVIGATTLNEYRENIEKDTALSRRFQKVIIKEPTTEEAIHILDNIKDKYEGYHNVTYTKDAIESCVTLSQRYITDRFLPDKAIDVLDEAGATTNIKMIAPKKITNLEENINLVIEEKKAVIKSQEYEKAATLRDKESKLLKRLTKAREEWLAEMKTIRTVVTGDMIREIISRTSGVPVTNMDAEETKKLGDITKTLKATVIGQDDAIEKVTAAIKVGKLGLKNPNKPLGTFMFLGVTGTGKTHLAQMIAKHVFGDEKALIRVDMAEYGEKFAASRLTGPPPGYVGYESGGELTEKVRRKPYSVILFDEIEKAHKDTYNMLLPILDEGHITDSLGRKIDFKNTIIIMTSNTGVKTASDAGNSMGFATDSSVLRDEIRVENIIKKELKKEFAPEFLNRLDDIIFFKQLTQDNVMKIVTLELSSVIKRFNEKGYNIKLNKSAVEFLAKEGYDPKYGARPLKRAINKYVERDLANKIVDGEFIADSIIKVSHIKGTDYLTFK